MNYPLSVSNLGNYRYWFVILICGYAFASYMGLQNYIRPLSVHFILGTMAVVSSLTFSKKTYPVPLAMISIAVAILYMVFAAKTFVFISIGMAVFSLAAIFHLKINSITLFSLAMMSPLFDYAIGVFSFPVRLFLTSVAGKVMGLIDPATRVEGNIIISNNAEFSVDPACLGLHMLTASMLAGLLIISHFVKKRERRITFAGIVVCMVSVFLLNVLSNLIRIVCLVYWKIAPGTGMHEVVGMMCFMLYLILPAVYIISFCVKMLGKKAEALQKPALPVVSRVQLLMNSVLLLLLMIVVIKFKNNSLNEKLIAINNINIPGYVVTQLEHRVVKLENSDALIYIKPIAGFYSSDHQPMICWAGSGYQFTKVQERQFGVSSVYTAVLEKGNDQLYTAWWYDNGVKNTIGQLEWRWDALRSRQQYSIINVTASSQLMLENETKRILMMKLGKRV